MTFILALLLASPSKAMPFKERAKAFCERHLIANDPRPFAQLPTDVLIREYEFNADPLVFFELEERMHMRWSVTPDQVHAIMRLVNR